MMQKLFKTTIVETISKQRIQAMFQFKQLSLACLLMLLVASSTSLAFAAVNYGFIPNVPSNIRPGFSHRAIPSGSSRAQKSHELRYLLLQLENLEQICESEDNFTAARNVLYTELSILKESKINDSVQVGAIYSRLGALYSLEKMFSEAEQNYKLAISNLRNGTGNSSLEVALNLNNLGWSQAKQKHFSDAEHSYRKGLYIFSKTIGEQNVFFAMSACNLADIYLKTGRTVPALTWYTKASKAFDSCVGKDAPVAALLREKCQSLKGPFLKSKNQAKSLEPINLNDNDRKHHSKE